MNIQDAKVLAKTEEKKEVEKKKKNEGDEENEEEEENQQEENQQDEENQQSQPKLEPFLPETVVVFKKIEDHKPLFKPEIEQFYRSHQMDTYVCDSSRRTLHENIENITINIERNGRPNNYLEDREELTKLHLNYYKNIDQEMKKKKESEKQKVIESEK